VADLAAAVQAVLAHHEIFRARFTQTDTGGTQTLTAAPPGAGGWVEGHDAPPTAAGARAWVEAEAAAQQRQLDVTHGPLVRAGDFAAGPALAGGLAVGGRH